MIALLREQSLHEDLMALREIIYQSQIVNIVRRTVSQIRHLAHKIIWFYCIHFPLILVIYWFTNGRLNFVNVRAGGRQAKAEGRRPDASAGGPLLAKSGYTVAGRPGPDRPD